MEAETLNPPRGMRDITGDEAKLYYTLFSLFSETASENGFEPIITPTVEYYRLFEVKSGEEIRKSMYVFEDKAGRLLALRPEVTASVIRVYLKEMRARPKPIRLYYISQCFRYEEPQKARYREFWQGGLEIIGDETVNADVSAAYTASRFLDKLGLDHKYLVGNVAIYRAFMNMFKVPGEEQDHILHLIDKEMDDQLEKELLDRYGSTVREVVVKLMRGTLDSVMSLVEEFKQGLGDEYNKVVREARRLEDFSKTLSDLGYKVEFSPRLVRGLAYYTGLIWEYKATRGIEQSIGGGGRYDGLTSVYSSVYEYSTGLALGLDRIALILMDSKDRLLAKRGLSGVIVVLSENIPLSVGYGLVKRLSSKFASLTVLATKNLDKALRVSSRTGVDLALIIGEREFKDGKVTVRDLNKKTQEEVPLKSIEDYIDTYAPKPGST
ncbi:histidine--tRNA ligase [Thermogladius sp. KZ2Tp1]|uniref:histidine--tRNA ligase n=1 Tax=Thermogladius sp. KZ2Tp1 TaxID=3136289 RepID=UPI003DA96C50